MVTYEINVNGTQTDIDSIMANAPANPSTNPGSTTFAKYLGLSKSTSSPSNCPITNSGSYDFPAYLSAQIHGYITDITNTTTIQNVLYSNAKLHTATANAQPLPTWCNHVHVFVVGGGGGGGASGNGSFTYPTVGQGGQGQNGEVQFETWKDVNAYSNYNVIVGTGGVGGKTTPTANNGQTGNDSSITFSPTVLITANGGAGCPTGSDGSSAPNPSLPNFLPTTNYDMNAHNAPSAFPPTEQIAVSSNNLIQPSIAIGYGGLGTLSSVNTSPVGFPGGNGIVAVFFKHHSSF